MDKICAFPSTGEVFSSHKEKKTRDQRKCPEYCYRALGHSILSKYSIKKEFAKKRVLSNSCLVGQHPSFGRQHNKN